MSTTKGFTLIELLIVIVLIAVITGMAMLSMGTADPRDQQKQEAERLVKLLELGRQEAITRGDSLGLELFTQGYRFAVIRKQKWQTETSDMVFRPRSLMPKLQLVLLMEKKNIILKREPIESVDPQPQIILTPDGDMDLFELSMNLTDGDSRFVVSHNQQDGLVVISAENKP